MLRESGLLQHSECSISAGRLRTWCKSRMRECEMVIEGGNRHSGSNLQIFHGMPVVVCGGPTN